MSSTVPIQDGKQYIENHPPDKVVYNLSLSSQAVHADDFLNTGQDIAPPLHVSTTYRYNRDPSKLKTWAEKDNEHSHEDHIYSRHTMPNTTRFEAILSTILKGPALTYSSGLSAFHAALVFLNPKRIAIRDGYHGCHGVINVHTKLTGLKKLDLYCDPEELEAGDIVHVETPLNPTGQAYNLKEFADKAHSRGAFLLVDATFAPPPLQDPFVWGADIVLHSGTKYIGGHSDMLCGILAVHPQRAKEGWFETLASERLFLGNVMGNMEGWLGIRSIRTLEVRVERQSFNSGKLVAWLDAALYPEKNHEIVVPAEMTKLVQQTIGKIEHASLQKEDISDGWLLNQMPNGFGPVFSITMTEQNFARRLPSKLDLFHHATSLGGVESLIEWRSMTDSKVDTKLLRVSIGIEGWEDLKNDLLKGLKELVSEI